MEHTCEKDGYCSWMGNFEKLGLGKQNLLQTILPGSHDSATCNITTTKDYASNAPPILLKAKRFYSGRALKNLVCRWAVAQERTIFEQLCDGIRYIDLRICSVKKPGEEVGTMYTCHSVISDKLEEIIEQINLFAELHPKEIVIVDFNHFYDMDDATHQHLVSILQNTFGNKMIPSSTSIQTPIEEFWKSGCSLLVFYEKHPVVKENEFLWSQIHIHSAWMNTPDINILKSKLYNHLNHRQRVIEGEIKDKKRDYRRILHVSQGILTPDGKMIAGSVFGRKLNSLTDVGKFTTPLFTQWVSEEWKHFSVNILLSDHYHYSNFVDIILQMNENKLLVQNLSEPC